MVLITSLHLFIDQGNVVGLDVAFLLLVGVNGYELCWFSWGEVKRVEEKSREIADDGAVRNGLGHAIESHFPFNGLLRALHDLANDSPDVVDEIVRNAVLSVHERNANVNPNHEGPKLAFTALN